MHPITVITSLSLALTLQSWLPEPTERWADFDADGRRDVLLIAPDGSLRLFLNDAQGQLHAVDSTWGLEGLGEFKSFAVGDADGDRLSDLFLVGRKGDHRLMRNLGGSFVDVTAGSGLADAGELGSATWIDYDGDGSLDLRVSPMAGGLTLYRNEGAATFARIDVTSTTIGGVTVTPTGTSPSEGEAGTPPTAVAGGQGASSNSSTPAASGTSRSTTQAGTGIQYVPLSGAAASASPPAALPIGCARDMLDAAGGPCLPASSIPAAGHLLPLGPHFFIDGLGQTGIGTDTPQADLHVDGGSLGKVRISSSNTIGPERSTLQFSYNPAYSQGMELTATHEGLEINSRKPDHGGTPQTDGPHIFVTRQSLTEVGIAETNPEATLHVDGSLIIEDTMKVRRPDGLSTIELEPDYAGGGGSARVVLDQSNGLLGIVLDAENSVDSGSKITMYGDGGTLRVELDADEAGAAFLRLYKANNTVGIKLDADQNGDARITTEVLEITGGADLVESFDTGEVVCEPGTVVAIDPQRPGELTPSTCAYDKRVAGIVSGAGGVQPGLHMGQTGVASGSTPIALTGRVYVRCNKENGPIVPGDMLTTSSSAGVAMRASDPTRSFGSVIGKAMTPLDDESGLVLVLVNLQ